MPKKSLEERKYEDYLAEKKQLEAEKKEIEQQIDSVDVEISKLRRMQVLGEKGEFTASAK